MKLSDVMSAADLAIWAEVALIVFFLVFVLIVWRVLGGRQDYSHARRLPLDDGEPGREERDGHE